MKNNNLYPVFAFGKWGLVNSEGNQVIPIIYTSRPSIYHLQEVGTLIVTKDDKYGVLDIDNCQEIIPTVYDDIRCCDEKIWCLLKDEIWYVWEKGTLYEIGGYDSVSVLNKEFIQFKVVDTVFGNDYVSEKFIYSITERTIIPKSETHIFYNDLAMICTDGKYGFINRSLELVISAIYDYAENFESGFAYVKIEDSEYYIDTTGLHVISGPFYHTDYSDDNCHEDAMFMEGIRRELVCYEEDGLIGLKGLHNRIVTLPIYDCIYLVYNVDNKCISVIKNGKYGVIDNEGNIVIECEYDHLSIPFGIEDIFVVDKYYQDGSVWKSIESLIDIRNKQIIPPIYSDIRIINNNMAIVAIDNEDEYKYGVLDFHLQEFIIPLIYDECSFSGDLFFVEKNGKWGYLDLQGNEVMKVEHDFDYSIYSKYFRYYPAEEKERAWKRILDRSPIDFSKCSLERDIHFKDWSPIVTPDYSTYSNEDGDECPF